MDSAQWQQPPPEPALLQEHVHVWRAALDQPAACVQRLSTTLSADERARAARFYFERDRRRFIVGRGSLRTILGRYLGLQPEQLRFCYSAHGKPYLDLALRFNLAHSHGLALYAITSGREVGVDVEYVHPITGLDRLVERFFSARERTALRALPASQKQEAFFNCWTRKEAYVKAIGDGLACPLDQFDVSLTPGKPARVLSVAGDSRRACRWFIQGVASAPGYVAAVATTGRSPQLQYWDFEP